MTSKSEAFVWIWLPNQTEPVVCGKLQKEADQYLFNYGKSYLARTQNKAPAIPIYDTELPLRNGLLPLLPGLTIPGCIRDAAPDAWGRRVIINKMLGHVDNQIDTANLDEITYLLESGSDRIGALDFQHSSSEYVPRTSNDVTLEQLLESADKVEQGIPLDAEIDQALFHGSSIGGARPKAMIEEENVKYVAKFPLSSDLYNTVKTEYLAMRLAKRIGLNVAQVKSVKAAKKDILLIKRFDREKKTSGWQRKIVLSSLTLLGLDEIMARYASYTQLAELIRTRFVEPKKTLKELFSRMVFNILCGNTDDHARNHAAFWDGVNLVLTPAYDICPQSRTGNIASQAMNIVGDINLSQIKHCLNVANYFLLSNADAYEIFENQKQIIESNWNEICDEVELTEVEKRYFWKRQFLNPFALEDL